MKIIFANLIAIYRRELQSYFTAPWSYVVAFVFWLIAGLLFTTILFDQATGVIAQAQFIDLQAGSDLQVPSFDAANTLIGIFLGSLGSVALFIFPILSMGLYSEERKRGTLELLATSPVTNWAVAVAKLLGVVTFFSTLSLPLMVYEAIALSSANPAISPVGLLLGHGALILMAAAVMSLGMFISSLTDSTVVAAISTFGITLLLFSMDLVANWVGGPIGTALSQLSLLKHYTTLVQGVVDSSSIVVFVSYIALGIFLTAQSVEAFRFQRS
jgi:ABC-2 type transport system permease protein